MPHLAVPNIDRVVLCVIDFRRSEALDHDAVGCETVKRRDDLGSLHLRACISMLDSISLDGNPPLAMAFAS